MLNPPGVLGLWNEFVLFIDSDLSISSKVEERSYQFINNAVIKDISVEKSLKFRLRRNSNAFLSDTSNWDTKPRVKGEVNFSIIYFMRFLLTPLQDQTCIVWDLSKLTYVRQLSQHMAPITAIAINDLTVSKQLSVIWINFCILENAHLNAWLLLGWGKGRCVFAQIRFGAKKTRHLKSNVPSL